jgi:hypothetical protein
VVEIPYLAEALSGLLFLVVAFLLLRRASRTGAGSERLLGVAFLLMGTSYVFSEAPYAFQLESVLAPFSLIGRITYAVGVIGIAVFTLRVLQSDESWTRWLVYSSALLAAAGIGLTVLEEDWAGFKPLRGYGFWLEWVGLLVPFVWMGLAAFAQFGKARERARMGLGDPLLSSRFLLLGVFGLFQTCGFFVEAAIYIIFESQRQWTIAMDVAYAATDILSAFAVWLAFFPPVFYRSWIGSTTVAKGSQNI